MNGQDDRGTRSHIQFVAGNAKMKINRKEIEVDLLTAGTAVGGPKD